LDACETRSGGPTIMELVKATGIAETTGHVCRLVELGHFEHPSDGGSLV